MLRKMMIGLIICIYGASLVSVAFKAIAICDGMIMSSLNWRGYEVLLIGWSGVLDGTIAWYANLFLLLGLIFLNEKPFFSLIFSFIGFPIALSSLLYKKMWIDEHCPVYANIDDWGVGFYLWLLCFILLFVFSIILLNIKRDRMR